MASVPFEISTNGNMSTVKCDDDLGESDVLNLHAQALRYIGFLCSAAKVEPANKNVLAEALKAFKNAKDFVERYFTILTQQSCREREIRLLKLSQRYKSFNTALCNQNAPNNVPEPPFAMEIKTLAEQFKVVYPPAKPEDLPQTLQKLHAAFEAQNFAEPKAIQPIADKVVVSAVLAFGMLAGAFVSALALYLYMPTVLLSPFLGTVMVGAVVGLCVGMLIYCAVRLGSSKTPPDASKSAAADPGTVRGHSLFKPPVVAHAESAEYHGMQNSSSSSSLSDT